MNGVTALAGSSSLKHPHRRALLSSRQKLMDDTSCRQRKSKSKVLLVLAQFVATE